MTQTRLLWSEEAASFAERIASRPAGALLLEIRKDGPGQVAILQLPV